MITGIKKTLIGTAGILVAVTSLGFAAPAMADEAPDNSTVALPPGTLPPGQYSGGGSSIDGWSCNMTATGTYAPCKQDTPTTGDEAWQKGYKLTFNWEVPDDWRGNPYERCVLGYYNPQTAYSPESMAPIQIDVPAAWGTYTIPLERYGWLEDGITAGATTLKQETYCYTDQVGASQRVTSNSAIIPDMPPTTPTDVDATTDEGNVADSGTAVTVETGTTDLSTSTATTTDNTSVDLLVSGSKALGVSPLDGYQLALTNDANGASVADVNVAPKDAVQAVVAKASRIMKASAATTKAVNSAASTVKNLKPGSYTLRVTSYNKIGTSDPYTIKLVVKKGGKIATVKNVKVVAKGKTVTTKWSAVKGATGYVVQAVAGKKIVKSVKVNAKAHSASVKLAKGSYTLRVASLTGNRTGAPTTTKIRVR